MFLIGSNIRRLFRVQMPSGRADSVHGRCMGAFLDGHGGPGKKKCVTNGFRGNFRCSGKIERARAAGARSFHDVEVDHGGLMAAAAATLRASRCASVYLAPLGSTDAWPIRSWTVRMSVPDSSRWVAKQWRKMCGEMCFGTPLFRAASRNCRAMES